MSRLYFAYGSNLHPLRLAERVVSSEAIGSARLPAHALRFHKRGADGSAKCDIVPEPGGTVHGALFRLHDRDLAALDAAEWGYERVELRVLADGAVCRAFSYRAQPERIAGDLAPYRWYRELVVLGARCHGLPAEYVAAVEAVAVMEDPNAARAASMDALLHRLRASR